MIENTCRHGFTFLVFPASVRPCLFFRKPAYPLTGRADILWDIIQYDLPELITALQAYPDCSNDVIQDQSPD